MVMFFSSIVNGDLESRANIGVSDSTSKCSSLSVLSIAMFLKCSQKLNVDIVVLFLFLAPLNTQKNYFGSDRRIKFN